MAYSVKKFKSKHDRTVSVNYVRGLREFTCCTTCRKCLFILTSPQQCLAHG